MAEGNGNHVTWRELNLVREAIDDGFKTVNSRLDGIEKTVTRIKVAHAEAVGERRVKHWIAMGVLALFSGGLSTLLAIWLGG